MSDTDRALPASPSPRDRRSRSRSRRLIYVESHLSNTATKFYGELTQQMIKMGDSPGSDNGTGTDAAWSINFERTRSS